MNFFVKNASALMLSALAATLGAGCAAQAGDEPAVGTSEAAQAWENVSQAAPVQSTQTAPVQSTAVPTPIPAAVPAPIPAAVPVPAPVPAAVPLATPVPVPCPAPFEWGPCGEFAAFGTHFNYFSRPDALFLCLGNVAGCNGLGFGGCW